MENIRGHVVIKKNGNIIVDKDNMIVLDGRKYLRELFVNSFSNAVLPSNVEETSKGEYDLLYKNYSVSHVAIGDGSNATILNSVAMSGGNIRYIPLNTGSITFGTSGDMFMIIQTTIDNINLTDSFTVQELGLFLTNNGLDITAPSLDSPKKLFSRIVFDPIPVSSGDKYEVIYYIYF